MKKNINKLLAPIILSILLISSSSIIAQNNLILSNEHINIEWQKTNGKWVIKTFNGKTSKGFKPFGTTNGEYTFIYETEKPTIAPVPIVENGDTLDFPEDMFVVKPDFRRATSAVPMNRAGNYYKFYPTKGQKDGNLVIFEQETPYGTYKAKWSIDEKYPTDILLHISLSVDKDGFYSLPTPTISTITENNLEWGIVPGFFQGNAIQQSFPLSYAYAQGLPKYPVLCRESTTSTLASIISNKTGLTMAVIPEPGQDRNPYAKDGSTHLKHWKIALSHMDNNSQLTPTAYHPVLGEIESSMKKGDTVEFKVRISLSNTDWYTTYKHAVYDIYKLKYSFDFRKNKKSLVDRILKQYDYVLDDKTALWHKEEYKGREIMAQSYQTGVAGADNDAMKNSDIGAVWMLAQLTQDEEFNTRRIPYIRNFKILQQSQEGFFKGSVEGQYYLAKSKRFTEEGGDHFEPVAITYYTMADLGNILLFEPDNEEIKELLRNGAERLMEWQQKDGSWVIAYDRETLQPIYTDLKDYRPTFYGLMIAYKLFGDKKYLKAAEKGADWLINNSIKKGHFVGVCGDVRFVNDFATIQIAGAMYDLYEMTSNEKYLDAAIETARIYTTSIYTHPIPTREIKKLNGKEVEDWQLSQIGSSFEHGGSMGSAVHAGPILLASHCSFFLKLYQVTKDDIFRDMARLAAQGKDAFVNEKTGVASYYWVRFDYGSGPYPHHVWWQIGWIYDYLLAEAELRSEGRVSFPRGFMTPKVGTHKTAGFAPGQIDGQKVDLVLKKGLIEIDNPNIEYITAQSTDKNTLYVIFLNDQSKNNKFNYKINQSILWNNNSVVQTNSVELNSFGYKILKISKDSK